jgi:hypothetical protein
MSVAHDPSDTSRDDLQRHDLGRCRWWHSPEPSADSFATLARDIDLPAAVLDEMRARLPGARLGLKGWWEPVEVPDGVEVERPIEGCQSGLVRLRASAGWSSRLGFTTTMLWAHLAAPLALLLPASPGLPRPR